MISINEIYPTIPVTNLAKSRDFYEKIIGLEVVEEVMDGIVFKSTNNSLYIYKRDKSKANHTLASIGVTNLEAAVNELTSKGVKFEHYDLPGLKTDERGIMVTRKLRSAWFKDPDGNILNISERL